MVNHIHSIINLPDRSYQAIARAELKSMAVKAGLTGHRLAETEIIIAEITTNLVKHATHGGQVLCRILEEDDRNGLELVAIDNGPGIAATSSMLRDGVSTKNTLGQGLGAIKRLSDVFDIYSLVGWGTILISRVFKKTKKALKPTDCIVMESIRVSKPGETACGDNWSMNGTDKITRVCMADGLGHGPEASAAATRAITGFSAQSGTQANEHLRSIHEDIRKTRGAVMSIAYIDNVNKQLTYCGIGNILTRLISQPLSMSSRTFNSYNGIVGHTIPNTINNTVIPWDKRLDMLIMHTDGISGRWDLAKYPKILQHHSTILCAALFKDHFRSTDDATVSVIRYVKNAS
ncbi:ATP-binding protein/SpoIIE family protein phosphatase [Terrimonas sp. NA20]|uniref:ATP-binding protein/SpoIIE family protein phosphatase n=1 Tax=Terrimonas ginsenosidimutans TaxID=2908004 RepID=A0ABS9KPL7_9BACT|nr:ATP-binding SpoIIE family protein phosphatase [Terrimonas ginsenosidimutans]MCG2614262.1 ATP-binding protein/SpoIIE family protein phosphatase [Terrimonas ginsenosidimutans]